MNDKVSDSIKFLIAELKRLEDKKKQTGLSESEQESLLNLKKFLGK